MKIKVIGKQHVDYVSKNTGSKITGDKFFYTYEDRRTEGLVAESGFLPSSLNVVFPLHLPVDAELYFNKFGKIDEILFF